MVASALATAIPASGDATVTPSALVIRKFLSAPLPPESPASAAADISPANFALAGNSSAEGVEADRRMTAWPGSTTSASISKAPVAEVGADASLPCPVGNSAVTSIAPSSATETSNLAATVVGVTVAALAVAGSVTVVPGEVAGPAGAGFPGAVGASGAAPSDPAVFSEL